MSTIHILSSEDKRTHYAGYNDYLLVSPDGSHTVDIKYQGEPPHGDSYHSTIIDGCPLPGLAWGGTFGFSACSRYVVFSWMEQRYERKTIVVDMQMRRYYLLPVYIDAFRVEWPAILGDGRSDGLSYRFTGDELWSHY